MKKTLFGFVVAACVVQSSCVSVQPPLPVTAQALAGSYIDPQQQEVRFGAWSFDRVPYRAWMDTRSGDVVFRGFGVNFNVYDNAEVEPVAQVLAEAGVSNARVEIGMGSFSYDDPTKFSDPNQLERLRMRLVALQRNNIRPLILLNANSGGPAPIRGETVELLEDAKAGDITIVLSAASVPKIRAGYTGLTRQAYQTAYPLITNVCSGVAVQRQAQHSSAATTEGVLCALSAPLQKPLAKGNLQLHTLKVAPFAEGEVLEDGTIDPRARESLRAWETYVRTICTIVRDCLGTAGQADVGFDLEVWNEYTFGTEFLDGRYYEPRRKFKEKFTYTRDGVSVSGHEVLLPITVDFANNPANGLPGVRVISGFSNQRPWDNGAEMFPGQYAFSRHFYTDIRVSDFKPPANQPIIDALGKEHPLDGVFLPTMRVSMPEYWLTGIKTEMMSRDLQPFPNSFAKHFRFSLNPKGTYAPVWQTEFNLFRGEWSDKLMKDTGVKRDDPRFQNLLEHIAAKSLIRALLMLTHKGNEVIQFYSARSPMHEFGIISEGFFKGGKTFEESGLQLHTCKRMKMFLEGANFLAETQRRKDAEKLNKHSSSSRLCVSASLREKFIPRPLRVGPILEHTPLLLQKGNGTPGHPDYFARDRLAILPFQTRDDRYVVALYVVTHDVVHAWAPSADILDPARYTLPPQMFDITLRNLNGNRAKIRYYDPLTDVMVDAAVIASAPDSITIRLPLTDSPRLLEITERAPGVRITMVTPVSAPSFILGGEELDYTSDSVIFAPLSITYEKKSAFAFKVNVDAEVEITIGEFPSREGRYARTSSIKKDVRCIVPIPPLLENEGLKIVARANGLEARYPLWDHDPAFATPPLPQGVTKQDVFVPVRLPPLKEHGLAARHLDLDNGLQARAPLGRVVETLDNVFPVLAVSDVVETEIITHETHPAWRVKIQLDPTAHPGEQNLNRQYLIVPLEQGFGVWETRLPLPNMP